MGNVSRGLKSGGWYRQDPAGSAHNRAGQNNPAQNSAGYAVTPPQKQRSLYLKGTSVKVGGVFLAGTGFVFGAASLVFLLLLCIGGLATGSGLMLRIGVGAFGLFTLIFVMMALTGTRMACSVGRFRKYVKLVGNREYCDVKDLAQKTGRSAKAVLKDLEKMI